VERSADVPSNQMPVFWGEIAPCEHIAQFYEHDGVLIDTLSEFVAGGINAGESVIVIATRQHIEAIDVRLNSTGVNVAITRLTDQYITMVADEVLEKFMVKQWPDDQLFFDFVTRLIERARSDGRPVRAFGEMVALLWERGDVAATVRLEFLWNNLRQNNAFSLFCAYPRAGFTEDASKSMNQICAAHSRVI
jgi:MEDS: MEthanogen/methylotroph, DcmR Sensory domain